MSRAEYRITFTREGGKKQYKTFQRFANMLQFARTLTSNTRPELKPIIYMEYTMRSVGVWHTCATPDLPPVPQTENLSDPTGMIT